MKIKFLLVLLAVFLFSTDALSQSVVITGKKITYTRKNPVADFKKNFTINYPKVKARNPAVSRKIEAAIDYRTILGINLKEELTAPQWLEEADYDVDYNANGILSITLSMNGTGAYPSGIQRIVVVDTTAGNRVKAADVFKNVSGLIALIQKAQDKEVAASITAIKSDPDNIDPDPAGLFAMAKIRPADLEWFSVDERGVTFHYDYGFPHVILAMQPDGTFFFSWAQIKPFIRPDGLLKAMVR